MSSLINDYNAPERSSGFLFGPPQLSHRHGPRLERPLRRRRPRRPRRRAGLGRARKRALLGRHQGPEDLSARLRRELDEWRTPLRIGSLAPRTSGGFIAGTEHGIVAIDLAAEPVRASCSTRRKIFPTIASTTARSTGRATSGPARWTTARGRRAARSIGSTPTSAAPQSTAAIRSPTARRSAPTATPCTTTIRARQVTYAFDLDDRWRCADRRTFLQFGEGDGYPDGMTVDAEGCLWIAFWDGWCVRRFSPDGELLQTIEMPVARPTSCAFGGPDLDRLYITSASIGPRRRGAWQCNQMPGGCL